MRRLLMRGGAAAAALQRLATTVVQQPSRLHAMTNVAAVPEFDKSFSHHRGAIVLSLS